MRGTLTDLRGHGFASTAVLGKRLWDSFMSYSHVMERIAHRLNVRCSANRANHARTSRLCGTALELFFIYELSVQMRNEASKCSIVIVPPSYFLRLSTHPHYVFHAL
jgi:hypothetical protein